MVNMYFSATFQFEDLGWKEMLISCLSVEEIKSLLCFGILSKILMFSNPDNLYFLSLT